MGGGERETGRKTQKERERETRSRKERDRLKKGRGPERWEGGREGGKEGEAGEQREPGRQGGREGKKEREIWGERLMRLKRRKPVPDFEWKVPPKTHLGVAHQGSQAVGEMAAGVALAGRRAGAPAAKTRPLGWLKAIGRGCCCWTGDSAERRREGSRGAEGVGAEGLGGRGGSGRRG